MNIRKAVEFYNQCSRHDWTFEYSDDHGVYNRGSEQQRKLYQAIGTDKNLQAIYDDWKNYSFKGGKHPVLFAIVNDVDKPCWDLVAMRVAGGLRYINKDWPDMDTDRCTNLNEFGIHWELNEFGLQFAQVEPSTAEYAHGGRRDWQDTEKFEHVA